MFPQMGANEMYSSTNIKTIVNLNPVPKGARFLRWIESCMQENTQGAEKKIKRKKGKNHTERKIHLLHLLV